ncbi:unnamed protein product [Lampetra fluviatilis]
MSCQMPSRAAGAAARGERRPRRGAASASLALTFAHGGEEEEEKPHAASRPCEGAQRAARRTVTTRTRTMRTTRTFL